MIENINLIDISNACNNNASAAKIIKRLKLQNYNILLNWTGFEQNRKIKIILRFNNIKLTAHINIKNNMYIGRAGDYKVIDGWQLKILR